MSKKITSGIAIIVVVSVAALAAWRIVGPRQVPEDVVDTVGSRSLGEPFPTPKSFHPEENVLLPETEKILNSGQQFTILSLDPDDGPTRDDEMARGFHGYPILGKAEIRDPAERKKLLDALYHGIADSNGMAAACFDPRHGIRATLNGDTVDLVICFECMQIRTYLKNRQLPTVLTSRLPKLVFNRALRNANLPMAK